MHSVVLRTLLIKQAERDLRLVQIRIVGTLGLEKRFQKHRKLKCSKWGSRGPPMLHIKKEGAKDDFAKAEVGLVFQPWLFQPRSVSDLLDGGWFGHPQVCFSF